MSLDYPILPICQTAESFRNILSAMGPYRDSISLKKSPLLGLYTGSEAQLDLATVRYHALGAYAKSVYLVSCSQKMTIGDKIGIGLVADWLRFPKIARSSAHYFLT